MEVRPEVTIDLTPYGEEGAIIIGEPFASSLNYFKNEFGRRCKASIVDGVKQIKECPAGDLEVLEMMTFVHKAPFKKGWEPVTIEAFMEYCNKVDEKAPGLAAYLYDALHNAVAEFKESGPSPFQH